MLAADGRESQHHVKASRGLLRPSARKPQTHCRIRDLGPGGDSRGCQYASRDLLVGIGLRQGNQRWVGPAESELAGTCT